MDIHRLLKPVEVVPSPVHQPLRTSKRTRVEASQEDDADVELPPSSPEKLVDEVPERFSMVYDGVETYLSVGISTPGWNPATMMFSDGYSIGEMKDKPHLLLAPLCLNLRTDVAAMNSSRFFFVGIGESHTSADGSPVRYAALVPRHETVKPLMCVATNYPNPGNIQVTVTSDDVEVFVHNVQVVGSVVMPSHLEALTLSAAGSFITIRKWVVRP